MDVLPKDGDLVVFRAEMPGVKPEDVEVAVHNRVLTISGARKVDEEEERAGYYVRELRHGSFRRSMLLPEGVEEEKIHARYQDGILEVTLEGAAAAREPRRVQIEVPPSGQQGVTDVEVSESTQGAAPQGDVSPETPEDSTAVALTPALSPHTSPCGAGAVRQGKKCQLLKDRRAEMLGVPQPSLLLHAAEATLIHLTTQNDSSANFRCMDFSWKFVSSIVHRTGR